MTANCHSQPGSTRRSGVAITPAIADTTIYVGNDFGLAAFIRRLPVLSVDEPSLYGKQIGAAALLAFHRPTTKEAVGGGTPAPAEYNAIVAITPA